MSLNTILSEIWRFLKDKRTIIFIGAILISFFTIIGGGFLNNLANQTAEQEPINKKTANEEVQKSREYLSDVYEQEPAEFELFVQLDDGSVFINSFIFDEYFSSPEVVEKVENSTGISYGDTLEHERNLELYKTSQYRGSVAGIRDTSSNVITIRVQASENSEANLILANTFYEMVKNNEIPFLENLRVTMIDNPSIGEKLLENDLEMVSSPASLGTFASTESESNSNILYAIAGFILGLLITTFLLFIFQLFKNKINYAFQYSWDFNDHHVLYTLDPVDKNRLLVELLLYPKVDSRIIVSQESEMLNELMNNNNELININIVPWLSLNSDTPDEVIIIIESNITDKDWYNEQYQIAELYGSHTTIIQVLN